MIVCANMLDRALYVSGRNEGFSQSTLNDGGNQSEYQDDFPPASVSRIISKEIHITNDV
jgi:hypothetical protein